MERKPTTVELESCFNWANGGLRRHRRPEVSSQRGAFNPPRPAWAARRLRTEQAPDSTALSRDAVPVAARSDKPSR